MCFKDENKYFRSDLSFLPLSQYYMYILYLSILLRLAFYDLSNTHFKCIIPFGLHRVTLAYSSFF